MNEPAPIDRDPNRRTARRSLYPIGLRDRDSLAKELGGGLPMGSIVLVEGAHGAGKSAISQRIIYGLAAEAVESTVISTELSLSGFIRQMHSLGYDVTRHILDRRVLYLHADGLDGRSFFRDPPAHSHPQKSILLALMNATTMWEADVIFIDTFDSLLRNDRLFEALARNDDRRGAALELISFFRRITATGRTVVMTVDPTTVSAEVMGPFRSIVDVYLELDMADVGKEVRRSIHVKRFSGMGSQVGDDIGFAIRAGKGLVIENRRVV